MSITFNRAHLTAAARTALAEHDKVKAAYAVAVEKYKHAHAEEHIAPVHRSAVALRDGLTKLLRTSKGPVRTIDVRALVRGRSSISDIFYTEPSDYQIKREVTAPQGLLSGSEVNETRALLAVLDAATGDTITANELKLLGLKNLAHVFVAAGVRQNASGTSK